MLYSNYAILTCMVLCSMWMNALTYLDCEAQFHVQHIKSHVERGIQVSIPLIIAYHKPHFHFTILQ